MTSQTYSERVAAEVRAEMGRQRRSGSWLARALSQSQSAVQRRLQGDTPFDLNELSAVAEALDVPVSMFVSPPEEGAVSRRRYLIPEPRVAGPFRRSTDLVAA